jgi:outer membrane cobalamin receptor
VNIIYRNVTLAVLFFVGTISTSAQEIEKRQATILPPASIVRPDSIQPGFFSKQAASLVVIDTLKKRSDSTSVVRADSAAADSMKTRFLHGMGQIIPEVDTADALNQKQFLWTDAKYLGDLIWKIPGLFYRDLGEAGTPGQLNALGMDGRGIAVLLDGRPMNDPVTGTYNLSDLPLELIDHTETFFGSSSLGAFAENTMALNFVSRSYNSYRPMTKLRFVQDPKGTLLTDGLFTQNVARGLNLMIGFQRTVTLGRYPNASLDAWNIRTRLRYNISDRLNISLTDFYTKASKGLNGGIDPVQSISLFDETSAIVSNLHAQDTRSRRDVTLTAIARMFSDSASLTQSSLYYSTMEREYINSSKSIDDSTSASFVGFRLQQQLSLKPLHFTVGGTVERRQSDSTRTLPSHAESERSLFLQGEVRLTDYFIPSLSLRSTSVDGDRSFSTGIGIKSAIAEWLTVVADVSKYDRLPTMQERYWRDSIFIRPHAITKEQHALLQIGVDIHAGSNLQLNLTGFHRTVKDPILYQPAATIYGSNAISIANMDEIKSTGLNGRFLFHWHQFELLGVLTLTRSTQSDTVIAFIPDVILSGELTYRGTILFEHWDGKIGLRSRFFNRQKHPMQFDPQTLSYVETTSNLSGRSTTFDVFMILRIGDAHLSLSWNNILNAQYMLGPVYPMQGRSIRVGVHWVFMD